jgi:hypothetical protein
MNYRKFVHELSRIQEIRKSTIISLGSAQFLEPDDQHGACRRLLEMPMLSKDQESCLNVVGSIVAILATVISKPAAANPESGSRSGDRPLCRCDVTP